MTEEQKTQIANLRGEGYGYVRIAQALWHIREYGEIILQEEEACRESGGFPGYASRGQGWESFLSLLWKRGGADSWEEGEKVLLGQMQEQMVEQPS